MKPLAIPVDEVPIMNISMSSILPKSSAGHFKKVGRLKGLSVETNTTENISEALRRTSTWKHIKEIHQYENMLSPIPTSEDNNENFHLFMGSDKIAQNEQLLKQY